MDCDARPTIAPKVVWIPALGCMLVATLRAGRPRRAPQSQAHRRCAPLLFLAFLVAAALLPFTSAHGFDGKPRGARFSRVQPKVDATKPDTFSGYPDAPQFEVTSRTDKLTAYPCSTCHGQWAPDPTPRKLNTPHAAAMRHGNGRMWCLDCHALKNRDVLEAGSNKIHFDDSHLLCGQCHANRHRDWYFGAHGKRAANWRGERTLYNCVQCHDPHDPSIKPRPPSPVPSVRAGLEPTRGTKHEVVPIWERVSPQSTEAEP